MKKFFSMMAMAFVAMSMVSCGDDDTPVTPNTPVDGGKTTLATPQITNVSVTENSAEITWSAVENAGSYLYEFNGAEKTTLGTTITLKDLTADTRYLFKVKAIPSDTEAYAASAYAEREFTTEAGNVPTPGPQPGEVPASLSGSEYVLISLGTGTQEAFLPAEKITADWRTNDFTNFLYIWATGDTYVAGTSVGPNSYGVVEGWTTLLTASVGWAGAGWCIAVAEGDTDGAVLAELNEVLPRITSEEGWYFHFATKSPEGDKAKHTFVFYPTAGGEVKVTFGASGCDYNYTFDGEWYEFDVPVSDLIAKGLLYSNTNPAGTNVVAVLTESTTGAWVAGMELNLDAMFFYKK